MKDLSAILNIVGIEALTCLQRSVWAAPLSSRAAHNLGYALLMCKRPASAFCRLASSAALHPTQQYTVLLIAIALERLGDSRAEAAYMRAASLAPEDPLVRLNLAGRHGRAGRLMDALEEARVVAELLHRAPDAQCYHCTNICRSKQLSVKPGRNTSCNLPLCIHPSSPPMSFPPDVVEPWGSSHGELSRSPHSPGDAVATPQVVIGKCPSEKAKKKKYSSIRGAGVKLASSLATLMGLLRDAGVNLSELPSNSMMAEQPTNTNEDTQATTGLGPDEV
ncbi:jg22271 [Pararge aegeria aegeria]|uniref:Jg22271 protein n=1 Tax=Pararge aegeria aegeria TaxID=348720 RepID=A0A8S4QTK6_9NEOP|nr:jg22271 [Pararge aegeria aegeria]